MVELKTKKLDILLEDTYETYYWIGFLLADGYFLVTDKESRLTFSISKKDCDHLLKFRNYIGHIGNIRESTTRFGNSTPTKMCSVYIASKKIIFNIVNKFGIYNRKTINPPDIPFIKNYNLFISLVIGFIDGDGCIRNYKGRKGFGIKIDLYNTWDKVLRAWVNRIYNHSNNIRCPIIIPKGGYTRENKYYNIQIGNTTVCKEIKRKAIELDLPVLERKWDIINLNFVSNYEKALTRRNKVEMYIKQGKKYKEISDILDISYGAVYYIDKNIKLDKLKYNNEESL